MSRVLPLFLMVLMLTLSGSRPASSIFLTSTGYVHFVSEAPLELIEAENKKVGAVLDIEKRTVALKVPILNFVGFNSDLQHEHFNENYMEVNDFPNATFTGKIIENLDLSAPGKHKVRAKGMLTIHGVSKERILAGNLTVTDKNILLTSEFDVPLVDHDIVIPRIVHQKIAEIIHVEVKATLSPQS